MKNNEIKLHTELNVWKKSMLLVEEVYKLTSKLPDEEKYCLTSQIRRAVISIPSNIAEGSARQSKKELIQFLYYSLGSLAELDTQIKIAYKIYKINKNDIELKIKECRKLLMGYINYWKNK